MPKLPLQLSWFIQYIQRGILFVLMCGNAQSFAATDVVQSSSPNPSADSRFSAFTNAKGPGIGYVVVGAGRITDEGYFGYANVKNSLPISSNTRFNISSLTNQFTAAGIMLLEQRGKLSIEDQLVKYVPELPAFAKNIRLSNLIFHTAGLPDYVGICTPQGQTTNHDVISFLKGQSRLLFEAGSRYEYSNTGYVLLATVIERVTGKSYGDFLKAEFFDKLAMKNTTVLTASTESSLTERALGYGEWPFLDVIDQNSCNYVYGDGGIYTTTTDYVKWLKVFKSTLVFNEKNLKRIFTTGQLRSGVAVPYSFGWTFDDYEGFKSIYHTGAWRGSRVLSMYLQEQKLWVVLFGNYQGLDVWAIARDLIEKHAAAH